MIYKNFTKRPRGPEAAVFHPDNTYRKPLMILKIIQKAACDSADYSESLLWPWRYSESLLWPWRLFRKPLIWPWRWFRKSPMTLKMIQKVAYDPEDYSESPLWPLRLFRKPPLTNLSWRYFRTNEGWILGKINQRQRRELCLVFHGG